MNKTKHGHQLAEGRIERRGIFAILTGERFSSQLMLRRLPGENGGTTDMS